MHLTEEMVIARTKLSDLSTIKRINLWGCDLTDISIIREMINIEVLSLSINSISSLQPLEACLKLQVLYLRKNNITDFNELRHLQNLPELTELWLAENPCAISAGPSYRAHVLGILPKLKKLDDEEISAADIEDAMKLKFNSLSITTRSEAQPETTEEEVKQKQIEIESVFPKEEKEETQTLEIPAHVSKVDSIIKPQRSKELETPYDSISNTAEQPPVSTILNSTTQSLNSEILNIQYPDQNTLSFTENENFNMIHLDEQEGSVSARSIFLPELQQDAGLSSRSHEINTPSLQSNSTNTSTSTQWSSQSDENSQSNSNVASALLYLISELDIDGLQVLADSVRCRLDELM